MNNDLNPTTKRFSRSLAEAFPGDAADPIERPGTDADHGWNLLILAIAIVFFLAVAVGVL